ncbi:tumor necrosis factor receptor superfamily member 16 [Colossoma macropomum]|uniref:tumor necrosis factor receptor superfamily member 16 n=1 Tax=Colossoma macropomum TaxID=42526 RepID=UPI00186567B5|nr:tumor necrosis factor receptor superfamily member 16 [Colossoma macropomum]
MEVLRICIYALAIKVVVGDVCVTMRFTHHGECCSECLPGTGVASECGAENTKCQECQDGVTFSDSAGLSGCLACAHCPPGVPQLARCTVTQDTQCDCGEGFFLWRDGNSTVGRCAPCSVCQRGEEVTRMCGPLGNTECKPCLPGTFSEQQSASQPCQPCTRCKDDEVEIRACQPNSDTLCMERDLNIMSRPAGSEGPFPRWPGLADDDSVKGSGAASGSEAPELTPQDQGGNNILLYVSVLAAVVLGLLIYVAYKCWKSFQQKKALGKARAGELNNVAEGEKLHSDSGVFLDSHSLQDGQPSKGSKRDSKQDTRLYINLPPHRQEEVERLLEEGSGRSWRQLGGALGYEQERLDVFGRGEDPVRTLLTDWSQQDGSTLGLLCSALARVERHDVAKALTAPAQGVSVV